MSDLEEKAAQEAHPGITTAEILKEREISPEEFARRIPIDAEAFKEFLAGQRELGFSELVWMAGNLDIHPPEKFVIHQTAHRKWKKQQP